MGQGWTLALSWQPGFCATNPRAADCLPPVEARLTLHGLWPERGAFCDRNAEQQRIDESKRWCRLAQPDVSPTTAAALARVMPGTSACLDRHEWTVHGVCSSLPADTYFAAAVRLVDRTDGLAFAKLLKANAGGTITVAAVRASIAADFGADAGGAVQAICAQRQGVLHMVEIRLSLAPDGIASFPSPQSLHAPERRPSQRCPVNRPVVLDGP